MRPADVGATSRPSRRGADPRNPDASILFYLSLRRDAMHRGELTQAQRACVNPFEEDLPPEG